MRAAGRIGGVQCPSTQSVLSDTAPLSWAGRVETCRSRARSWRCAAVLEIWHAVAENTLLFSSARMEIDWEGRLAPLVLTVFPD